MSTTINKILFDISCPNPDLRSKIFQELSSIRTLNAIPISCDHEKSNNYLLQYGNRHCSVLNAVELIRNSTARVYISDGLLSEFFIQMDRLNQNITRDLVPINAYRYLRDIFFLNVGKIVHIHVRHMPGNDDRRMSLSVLYAIVSKENSLNEVWQLFETSDIDLIANKILYHVDSL